MVPKESPSLGGIVLRWTMLLAVAGVIASGAFYLYTNSSLRAQSLNPSTDAPPETPPSPQPRPVPPTGVAALGRIEPRDEITQLSAPTSLEGVQVDRLFIQEGDRIEEGQVVAILEGQGRRQAAVEKAKTDVQVAQARLAQVKAGASRGDLSAQEAVIARLEAELRNAEVEFRRNELLRQEGAISEAELDTKRLALDAAREELNQAKSSLESLAEVRPEEVQVAQAELDSALAAVRQAQAELDLTYIRSPLDGQVIKVHTRPGEVIGAQGIAEIGQTGQMYVLAQVYETDIEKVKPGQSATVTASSLEGSLQGEVEQIGLRLTRQDIFSDNPLADADNRVINVRIRLDAASSQRVSGLTNLQVQVVIDRG